jgi:hypothetical protein
VDLDQHIAFCIEAMQQRAAELGLAGADPCSRGTRVASKLTRELSDNSASFPLLSRGTQHAYASA